MACLLELSHELLHCIFTEIEPADIASVSRTCRDLNAYINGNRLLHKELYIRRYDELDGKAGEPDWEAEMHKAVLLEKILESEDKETKAEQLGFVAEQIDAMLMKANPDCDKSLNVELLREYFSDTANIDTFLCSSSLFQIAGTEDQRAALTVELRQASAKLHCLYGKPVDPVPSKRCSAHYSISPFFAIRNIDNNTSPSANTRGQTRAFPAHTVARSKVYDLRQYTDHTLWGPFTDDGTQTVDWEKVEAIMLVLGFNLNKFTDRSGGRFERVWDDPFVGAIPHSYIPPPAITGPTKEFDQEISLARELEPSIDDLDPYGVSGTWMRVVCFLDYNDLYAFNFSSRIPDDEPREPIDTEEGIIYLEETLQVTKVEPPSDGDDSGDEEEDGMDWSNFEGERLPIVHFRGSSRSLHASWDPNANSRIRGTVRQTPEGEIRWTTFSIFHGEERWRSEGIQVGGIRSSRGILGSWFDKDYDRHGPAGPTAFWKMSDDVAEEKTSSMPIAYF
ncbi:uncharacterized protein LTR77_009387 [Saxophila tyrrhenica]|uniref:F-box domain-containing protein n=1 Tax=Saxophila tyrrhenica TaxID=1690608 RepID=A0AAV9P0Y5_9PEZI|nr:hypothetical protein LTR77_009387 [Saxophila tyrrhenica]